MIQKKKTKRGYKTREVLCTVEKLVEIKFKKYFINRYIGEILDDNRKI